MGSKVRRRYTASGSLCRTALPQATTTTSQPSNMTCISTISKSHFESDDFGLLGSDDEAHVAPSGRGDVKREKRLERNRESARKCRKKRKAYVGDLEAKVQSVEEENAMLQLENQRLNALLKQLQAGAKDISVPEPSRKRVKSEFAVHAIPSPQQEKSLLAILTTLLLMTLASSIPAVCPPTPVLAPAARAHRQMIASICRPPKPPPDLWSLSRRSVAWVT